MLAGGALLLSLFGSVPEARPSILSYMFDALAQEDASAEQLSLWCALLSAVSTTHLLCLHAHGAQLIDWTCGLPSMAPLASHAVLSALLPLVPLHADFGRHVMILLRKMLVAPEPHARALAVKGFCTILSMGVRRQPAKPAKPAPVAPVEPVEPTSTHTHTPLLYSTLDLAPSPLCLPL